MEEYRQSDELQQSTVLCLFPKLASQRSWARFGLWDQISFRIDAVTPEEFPNRRFEVKFHISGTALIRTLRQWDASSAKKYQYPAFDNSRLARSSYSQRPSLPGKTVSLSRSEGLVELMWYGL